MKIIAFILSPVFVFTYLMCEIQDMISILKVFTHTVRDRDAIFFGKEQMQCIFGKKWDPGILDPSRFSGQIRKVEARLGKLAKIRKVETD